MSLVKPRRARAGRVRAAQIPRADIRDRVVTDGLLFARGGRRLRLRGVTYGPFAPDADGQAFPPPPRSAQDLEHMRQLGINALRTYHVPPQWFLDLADAQGLVVFANVPWVDVPCPKQLCFLDSRRARADARRQVRQAARAGRDHPCILAYGIGNEIRPDVVRWHGARRVERFLAELMDVAKQDDPAGLVSYANYPPTEYLDLSFLDFATFNVYLHDREAFRRYLVRLQNLTGERPLVLGELGMDTLRHGELAQAEFLSGHVEEATALGLAGAFVFAWTDEWHTGGHLIEDWAFGITRADRSPKAAHHALRESFQRTPADLLPRAPRASVIVCSYNGGRTLERCLRSLLELDYPDYEVILVDDGSTDETQAIAARFPSVRAIHQTNQGLGTARNVGLWAATGQVIAYTDSDCFADPDWLTLLVAQLLRSGAAAVGGPNLSPEDGRVAACVAAAPGQPTHVLEADQVAEHIPGCNMAYRREALEAINGFDPVYRKAGDDVDVCWRLQHEGYWISFAPGAFVWHHRRQTPRTYLRQQAGYGEAEALLRFQHPDKFNGRGDGKWRGVLYGASSRGLRLAGPVIYRGTFATGMFQTIYRPGPAHWAMLPGSLEWHLAAAVIGLAGVAAALSELTRPAWLPSWIAAAAMLGLSLVVAAVQAAQARLAPAHDGFGARCRVAALCYLQPLVRSWARHRTRLLVDRRPVDDPAPAPPDAPRMPLSGSRTVDYWAEAEEQQRTELLDRAVAHLTETRWGKVIGAGWTDWDLEISCHPWAVVQVLTVQEDHGGGKRVIRIRYRQRPSRYLRGLALLAALAPLAIALGARSLDQPWPVATATAVAAGAALVPLGLTSWWRGTVRASRVVAIFDRLARGMGLVRCGPSRPAATAGACPAAGRRADAE